jgi:hypothetical protein
MLVGIRILPVVNLHQHKSKRHRISEFLADDRVQVRVCFRRVIRGIDEDLSHFGEVDRIRSMDKPYNMLARM